MFEWLKNLFADRTFGAQRSSDWASLRDEFLKRNPRCVACGRTKNLTVHHKRPFFLFPELELAESNLVVLCEGGPVNCHFVFGHCFLSWKSYNENVEKDINFITNLRNNAQPKKQQVVTAP